MPKNKKISVLDFAKLQAFLFGLLGLIAGILYAFGGLLIDILVSLDWMTSNETSGLGQGSVLAFGALIAMPLLAYGAGFLLGIFESILFNLFSKLISGMKFRIINDL